MDTMMKFDLPKTMFNECENGVCYIANLYNMKEEGRKFGNFYEKTLICNKNAHDAINDVCEDYGFEPGIEPYNKTQEELYIYTKLPVKILINLMLTLDNDKVVQELTGAYPIAMNHNTCTCMNIIIGRRIYESGEISIDKFSLYYPDNNSAYEKYDKQWPILNGYSFRTAVLNGVLNRADLSALRNNEITQKNDAKFVKEDYGLIIDDLSEHEDCAYMSTIEKETNEELFERIKTLVSKMIDAYGGETGILALSYDIKEKEKKMTAIESEFKLFEKYAI